jgi:FkbM family methyltransferase
MHTSNVPNDPSWKHLKSVRGKYRTVFVEPIPSLFERLKVNAAKDFVNTTFVNAAIAEQRGTAPMFCWRFKLDAKGVAKFAFKEGAGVKVKDWMTQICSFSRERLYGIEYDTKIFAKLSRDPGNIVNYTVATMTVTQLLRRHDIRDVRLVQIDVEGFDATVVRQLPLGAEGFCPFLLSYEDVLLADDVNAELRALLQQHGYRWFHVDQNTFAYRTNSCCPSSESPSTTAASEGPKPLPPISFRTDLGRICEEEHFKVGIELGVQRGIFAEQTLKQWKSCEKYVLVDLWGNQNNYRDAANVGNEKHNKYMQEAMRRMKPFEDRGVDIQICRNYTQNCVHLFTDESIDYIYVDARHDFKGVYEDLVMYWPKLKRGGIMAGHDYMTQALVSNSDYNDQDWTVNYDGTKDETGTVVQGAVNKFSLEVNRQITVTYQEKLWWSWAMRK